MAFKPDLLREPTRGDCPAVDPSANERRKRFAESIDGRLPTPKQLEQLGEMTPMRS